MRWLVQRGAGSPARALLGDGMRFQIRGQSRGKRTDFCGKPLGIAIDTLDPFLQIAVAVELLKQFSDCGQNDFGLGRRSTGFKTNPIHLERPILAPFKKLTVGRLKRKPGAGLLGPGGRKRRLKPGPFLSELVLSRDHLLGQIQRFGQIEVIDLRPVG